MDTFLGVAQEIVFLFEKFGVSVVGVVNRPAVMRQTRESYLFTVRRYAGQLNPVYLT